MVEHTYSQSKLLPRTALLIPPQLMMRLFSQEAEKQLRAFTSVVVPSREKLVQEEMQYLLQGCVACITGWGTPPFTEEILHECPQLRFIAHTAGSIRALLPLSIWKRGIRVSHAAAALASAVAEFTLLQMLFCLRRLDEWNVSMKSGYMWDGFIPPRPGRLLRTQTVGIVGTGRIGREVIALLKPFGSRLLVYDPYLQAQEAEQLGVEVVDLHTLCAHSDILSLHVPLLPETQEMIGIEQLSLLHDGALLLNTARAGVVNEQALARELISGRLFAALDVFHQEPLPPDNYLRTLPNVILSPHAAGFTEDTLLQQGQMMVDELRLFFHGYDLMHEIKEHDFAKMA